MSSTSVLYIYIIFCIRVYIVNSRILTKHARVRIFTKEDERERRLLLIYSRKKIFKIFILSDTIYIYIYCNTRVLF